MNYFKGKVMVALMVTLVFVIFTYVYTTTNKVSPIYQSNNIEKKITKLEFRLSMLQGELKKKYTRYGRKIGISGYNACKHLNRYKRDYCKLIFKQVGG